MPEVWIVDRDTRRPQVLRLVHAAYEEMPPAADGWVHSPITGVWLRAEPEGKLTVQMAEDSPTRQLLPED